MASKKITVSFDTDWILTRKEDDILPVQVFLTALGGMFSIKVEDAALAECTFTVEGNVDEAALADAIWQVLGAKYGLSKNDPVVNIAMEAGEGGSASGEPMRPAQPEAGGILDTSSVGGSSAPVAPPSQMSAIEAIRKLVGVEEFKALCEECVRLAPGITKYKTHEAFTNQCYLFAINDGNGLTTYLRLFAGLLQELGLFQFMPERCIVEGKVLPPNAKENGGDPFHDVLAELRKRSSRGGRLFCIDISEWMTKTNDKTFKQFLAEVDDQAGDNIIIFRVPFVENDILRSLNRNLGDLLFVRNVSFVPFNNEELTLCAAEALTARGFEIEDEAWSVFQTRIAEEKNDGRFYGINTVNKVVREMIYRKQLDNAFNGVDDNRIKKSEILGLVAALDDKEISGLEVLDGMIGMEGLKARVVEIVAQIETALKNRNLGTPCIHMRFVGNPGTGKTTVARVVGRILKERGILRNGSFFEYAGRDFCGRYVGETAPKTAAMCRDAYGSVLFIDEAYTLYRGDGHSSVDYGREAIDTLIAEMENHRSDLVVIMAGYPDEMEQLMKGNAGLESRMPYVIEFPNYTREQLYTIFMQMVNKNFTHEEGFAQAAEAYFLALPEDVIQAKEFSNARFVRNLFERTWGKAVLRSQMNKEDSTVLTKEDFLTASSEKEFNRMMKKQNTSRLGFL